MMTPRVVLLVEDEAVRRAIRFALEVEDIDVMICSGLAELQRETLPPGSCIVIDRGADDRASADALGVLKGLRMRGVKAPAIILATTPSKTLRARVSGMDVAIVEKPLLCDQLGQAIRGCARDRGVRR